MKGKSYNIDKDNNKIEMRESEHNECSQIVLDAFSRLADNLSKYPDICVFETSGDILSNTSNTILENDYAKLRLSQYDDSTMIEYSYDVMEIHHAVNTKSFLECIEKSIPFVISGNKILIKITEAVTEFRIL